MSQPVVLIAEELSPATIDALGPEFEIRHVDGSSRPELLAAVPDVDAVLIRSATAMDAEAIAAAPKLKIIARAGVGLDNVDVPAATDAGVMVVNAPTSNIISAAELTMAHILASARNVGAGNTSLKNGEWKRSKYTGIELFDKTLGIVGLGRIGALVTARAASFGMHVVAFDPYISAARASQMGVQLLSLDELLETADFITVHMPKTPETIGLIGDDALTKVKPTARIINVARGGIVDEDALARALSEGRVGGAGIDVFASEPTTASPLFDYDSVVVTPHLGASTHEAQEKAGVSVAKSVRLALAGELVPDAVNVAGGVIDEDVRPGIPLIERLGRTVTALAGRGITALDVEVHGEIASLDVSALKLAALKGLFSDIVSEQVSYVNAGVLAERHGVDVRLITDDESEEFRNVLTLRAALPDGGQISVSGTLTGPKQIQKLIGVGAFDLEIGLSDHLLIFEYQDKPGVIGRLGHALGSVDINIAGMQVARAAEGGRALSVLAVDGLVSPDMVAKLGAEIDAERSTAVNLEE